MESKEAKLEESKFLLPVQMPQYTKPKAKVAKHIELLKNYSHAVKIHTKNELSECVSHPQNSISSPIS